MAAPTYMTPELAAKLRAEMERMERKAFLDATRLTRMGYGGGRQQGKTARAKAMTAATTNSGVLQLATIEQLQDALRGPKRMFTDGNIVPQRGAVWAMVGETCKTAGIPEYVIDFWDIVGARFPWTSVEVRTGDNRWVIIYKYELFDIPIDTYKSYTEEQLSEAVANQLGDAIVAQIGEEKARIEAGAEPEEWAKQRERESAIEEFGRDIDLGPDVKRN